jgi:hypothetical protein
MGLHSTFTINTINLITTYSYKHQNVVNCGGNSEIFVGLALVGKDIVFRFIIEYRVIKVLVDPGKIYECREVELYICIYMYSDGMVVLCY